MRIKRKINIYLMAGKLKILAFLHQERLKYQMLFKLRGYNMDLNIVSNPQFMQVWVIHWRKLQLNFLMKMNHLNHRIKLKWSLHAAEPKWVRTPYCLGQTRNYKRINIIDSAKKNSGQNTCKVRLTWFLLMVKII